MAIEILDAEDGDMYRFFEIASVAFGTREALWNASWPEHWTPSGREAGAQKFRDKKNTDATLRYMKAVESSSGEIVGVAKWGILVDQMPDDSKRERLNNDQGKDYLQYLASQFFAERRDAIARSRGNIMSLDVLAVDPVYQRRGVATALVSWGTKKADELGLEIIVEGSSSGEHVYIKQGFTLMKRLRIEVPSKWAHLGGQEYSWLVRPKQD